MEIKFLELLEHAKKASENTYSPYSKFPVGACVLYQSGNIYVGTNVENSSYGLTLCAERNAISTAIAMGEKTKIVAIAIYSPTQKPCTPCGACRQWIQEFKESDDTKIISDDKNSELKIWTIDELLPHTFEL
ncbi:cytidine deaminase [bacterium]|nr:cytidine deaminase [bacterium]